MKKCIILLSVMCMLLWSSISIGQETASAGLKVKLESLFEAATDAYNKGQYELAIDYYDNILKGGYESVGVYYNLANAHYKQNHIAQSIYFYEKALLLDPSDKETLKNLSFARKMTIDAIPTKIPNGLGQAYGSYVKAYSIDFWSYAAILTLALFVCCYLLYYFSTKTTTKRTAFSLAVLLVVSSIFSFFNGLLVQELEDKDRPAIVFETTKGLSEPNKQGTLVFELHEGTKVQILEIFNDWSQIKLSDAQTAWVPSTQIRALKE